MEVAKDGGVYRPVRFLANRPENERRPPSPSLGQSTSYLERVLDTGLSLEACRRADNGA